MAPSRDAPITRRRAIAVAASIAIAGCTGGDGDDASDSADGNDADGDGTDDDTGATDGADGSGTDGPGGNETDGDPGTTDGPLADVPESVTFEPIVSGIDRPIGTAVSPTDDLRYVVQQSGRILGVNGSEQLDGPVLDLGDAVVTQGNEQGLLGLALHPEFANNRRAFVRYSAPPREGTPDDWSHTFVLSEFEVSGNGTSFLPDSERAILEIPEPQANHNAGDLAFGPEGYLYVPVGDGGAGDDQGEGHVDDWYDSVDGGNGQDVTENLLGSILRIDVDGGGIDRDSQTAADEQTDGGDQTGGEDQPSDGGGDPYAIPEDNPLVGQPGLDEHYAWGLRNPWRISFDFEADDADGSGGAALYVADVGQREFEEVNRVTAGGNYGWNVKEATHCFLAEDCPDQTPSDVRDGEPLVDPVIEYPHGGEGVSGISVIGGHVYRGSAIPGLAGSYVFGDLNAGNQLFVAASSGGDGLWPTTTVAIEGADVQSLFAFGLGDDGELTALGTGDNGGSVWRIRPAE